MLNYVKLLNIQVSWERNFGLRVRFLESGMLGTLLASGLEYVNAKSQKLLGRLVLMCNKR